MKKLMKILGFALLVRAIYIAIVLVAERLGQSAALAGIMNLSITAPSLLDAGLNLGLAFFLIYYRDTEALLFYEIMALLLSTALYLYLSGDSFLPPLVLVVVVWVACSIFNAHRDVSRKPYMGPRIVRSSAIVNKDKRRYTLLVETCCMERGLHIHGHLQGRMLENDPVLVFYTEKYSWRGTIASIAEAGVKVGAAEDAEVDLVVNGLAQELPRYSVITSVQPDMELSGAHENPVLEALLTGYGLFRKDPEYIKVFAAVLLDSRFVVPVSVRSDADSEAPYEHMTFAGVLRRVRPGAEPVQTFAVYTSNTAMNRRAVENDLPHSFPMVITFSDAVKVMRQDFQGLVINPFGPVFVYLPPAMVEDIAKSEAYQEKYGRMEGFSFESGRS